MAQMKFDQVIYILKGYLRQVIGFTILVTGSRILTSRNQGGYNCFYDIMLMGYT